MGVVLLLWKFGGLVGHPKKLEYTAGNEKRGPGDNLFTQPGNEKRGPGDN